MAAANDTDTVSWTPEPRGRGTLSLLISCLVTLGICVWTALHLNVPQVDPQDAGIERTISTFMGKCLWAFMALIAPEFVLAVALHQFLLARYYQQFISSDWGFRISMSTAFYAIMGGFLVDGDEVRPSFRDLMSERYVSGVYLYPIEDIADKSKANIIAKGLACLQVVWLTVQCLGRKSNGLPITLLELHTVVHVCSAVVMYGLWWNKPVDVSKPSTLPDTRPPRPERRRRSRPRARNLKSELREVQEQIAEVLAKHPRKSFGTEATSNFTNSSDYMTYTTYSSDYSSASSDTRSPTENIHPNGPPNPTPRPPNGQPNSTRGLSNGQLNSTRAPPNEQPNSMQEPPDVHPETPQDQTSERPNPAKESSVDVRVQLSRLHKQRDILLRRYWLRSIYYAFSSGLIDNQIISLSHNSHINPNRHRLALMIFAAVVGLAYTGLHATKWNGDFPTRTEHMLWRISCCVGSTAAIPLTLRFFAKERLATRSSALLGTIVLLQVLIWPMFIAARVFLVIESFISLRALPKRAYDTPRWLDGWPHV